ncbi:acyltransferase [Priestia megaterium]|uniref:acyltransferase n=1 Tax=Priestia megaterium TaxID=1404 RepID=UPI000BFB2D76|nr:acyltransferase [Priestia megaterium]PGN06321.1 transferase [Priestia megaterium]
MFVFKISRKISLYISRICNFFLIKEQGVKVGKYCVFKGKIYFSGKNSIKLGDNVRINSGKHFNVIGGNTRTIIRTIGPGKINIGNGCGISNSAIIAANSVTIEDNVLIGGNCKIFDTDFHPLQAEKRAKNENSDTKTSPILIKKGAFVGAHTVILKGVIVGENSIIGAGSVVTKNIPSNEIWAGNPAKFIREI